MDRSMPKNPRLTGSAINLSFISPVPSISVVTLKLFSDREPVREMTTVYRLRPSVAIEAISKIKIEILSKREAFKTPYQV